MYTAKTRAEVEIVEWSVETYHEELAQAQIDEQFQILNRKVNIKNSKGKKPHLPSKMICWLEALRKFDDSFEILKYSRNDLIEKGEIEIKTKTSKD